MSSSQVVRHVAHDGNTQSLMPPQQLGASDPELRLGVGSDTLAARNNSAPQDFQGVDNSVESTKSFQRKALRQPTRCRQGRDRFEYRIE